ncbi:phosphopyruvate hydratase [bacterium]|nr:phosphopyruvate hydratase [bacterium]
MAKIKKILAREILDSRGNPTIETKVILDNGIYGIASVPSGASTGKHEALELRDNDPNRFSGKGVLKACKNVEEIIAPNLIGEDIINQKEIDKKMIDLDGTKNKSKLGANAILSVSLACCRAGANSENIPLYQYIRQVFNIERASYKLPIPMFNIINGGKHSDSGLTIQEFMIIPIGDHDFKERLQIGAEIFYHLRDILMKRRLRFAVGDEGGFAPKLKTTKNVLDLMARIAQFSQYKLGSDVFFGLDAAASVFFDKKRKKYLFEGRYRSSREMIKIYENLFKKYPMILLEDPLDEDDWENWPKITNDLLEINPDYVIVGDDLYTTNVERLKKGLELKATNSILIKPNQIGTLSETIDCIDFAQRNNYKIVISHRSGETNDTFISDLAVAVNADLIKTGAPNRGERIAKYNRLAEIEDELKGQ